MSTIAKALAWPSSHDFVGAIQNPHISFRNPELRNLLPALDRFGMPLVASGNFAYAFKLRNRAGGEAIGVRCFRGYIPDRDKRYAAISRHLGANRVPCLTEFRFDQEGILVAGHRYPIVVMEWIEGPTLDLYVEQILHDKPALLHLADEWLRALHALRSGQTAHGDLQHGNIIVRNGQVRLIDLDGMFVPAMQGWPSLELGHPHFQHPRRDLTQFDVHLDNFSALVIYLTFLALADAPELWREYHDENLVFSRPDFLNPSGSKLLQRVRQLGPEAKRLAEVLEKAALSKPHETPWLLNLVSRKSNLPAWMTAPPSIPIKVRTREAPTRVAVGIPSRTATAHVPFAYTPVASGPSLPSALSPGTASSSQYNMYPFVNTMPPLKVNWKEVHRMVWNDSGGKHLIAFGVFLLFVAALEFLFPSPKGSPYTLLLFGCILVGFPYTMCYFLESIPVRVQKRIVLVSGPQMGNWGYEYHKPGCAWIPHGSIVYFKSPREARACGHKPCLHCNPGSAVAIFQRLSRQSVAPAQPSPAYPSTTIPPKHSPAPIFIGATRVSPLPNRMPTPPPPASDTTPIHRSHAVVADSILRRYHLQSCSHAPQPAAVEFVPFISQQDARAAGYWPCGKCNPDW